MDSKKLKRCAQIILFFYGASFLLTFLIGISNLIPPYIYIIFHPIFRGLLWILYIFREEKVIKSLNDSILFSFAPIAMFKPVKILLFKAENINETISNSDKILMCLYLLIAVCSIIKALSLNELYDNLKNPEKNS
jgi:hypothetical protein